MGNQKKLVGGKLRWDRALGFINEYNKPYCVRRQHFGEHAPEMLTFRFPSDKIGTLVNANTAAVYFAFGCHNDDTTKPNSYTLIAMGIDYQDNLQTKESDFIYDASRPAGDNPSNITIDQAKTAIALYKSEAPIPVRINDSTILNGFWFTITELKAILIQGAEFIECNLGYHESSSMYNNETGYTLIILGANADGIRQNGPNHEIFDYAHPCPKSCPNGLL